MFLNALKDNIERYENQYGDIKLFNGPGDHAFGFQIPVKPDGEKVN